MFKKINYYKTFKDMLSDVKINDINPSSQNIDDGLDIYLKPKGIYTKEKEEKYGVLAIYLH